MHVWPPADFCGFSLEHAVPIHLIFIDPVGPVAIILLSGSEVRRFDPAGVDGFFQIVKTLSMTSFGKEVKPWVSCCRFTALKRTSSRN